MKLWGRASLVRGGKRRVMERLRARIKAFERELHILGMILVIGAVLGVGGWLAGSGEAGTPAPAPTVTVVQPAAEGTPSAEDCACSAEEGK